jgi:proline iminopeptidase
MKSRVLALAALGIAGVAAFAVFVTFSWFRLGFFPLAVLALLAYWAVALPLLWLGARRPGTGGGRWVRGWMLGGTVVYVLLAQLMVGRRPQPALVPPEPAPGTQYWMLSNGSRLAWVLTPAQGTRQPTPIIVLHDGPGTPALSRLQRLAVRPYDFLAAEGFDVYYYDQLGAGLSGRIHLGTDPPYSVARHVQDLEEIRRRLGVPRLVLVGEGWGATLAVQYLLSHPGNVEKAVLESPAPIWYPAWPSYVDPVARARITDVQASALALLERPTLRLLIGRMMSDFNPRVAHEIIEDWEADEWWTRSQEEALRLGQPRLSCASETPPGLLPLSGLGFFAYSYTLRDAFRLPDPRPALASVQAPVLIVRGSCDYIDWRVSYEYLRALPGARYVAIPAAGHLVSHDQPSLHQAVLEAFVRGEKLPLEFYDPAKVRSSEAATGVSGTK